MASAAAKSQLGGRPILLNTESTFAKDYQRDSSLRPAQVSFGSKPEELKVSITSPLLGIATNAPWQRILKPAPRAVIQAPKPEPRSMRYELTDHEPKAIKPF